ncbi:MAG: transglutaminase family protein [Luteolibacter sp.]
MNLTSLVRIRHDTRYQYAEPVTFHPHRLVLRPREGHDLRVEQMELTTQPASRVFWSRDIFGNLIAHAHFDQPATELLIRSNVLVRRFVDDAAAPVPQITGNTHPMEYEEMERAMTTPYLTPVYPEDTAVVKEWIADHEPPTAFDSADAYVLHLVTKLKATMQYQRREQKGVQSPATTLTLKSGSCRDQATLLMEALRHLGIASRFASGYLDCAATRAAQGSTHAWTEVYFPQLGWRGFDPITGDRCGPRHIVTGTSHHPRGVMPVSGRYSGPSTAFLGMWVTVEIGADTGSEGR